MANMMVAEEKPAERVAVTLQVDAQVYEAFLRKAKQANMDIEGFLNSILTIVLGCRVFNEEPSCSPVRLAKRSGQRQSGPK